MHLIIIGHGNDNARMQDMGFIYQFLDDFPRLIGMTKIAPPYVTRYVGPKQEDWGLSGFVFIAESHISIHTFPERLRVDVDVYSCKGFDTQAAIEYVKETFNLTNLKYYLVERGLEYPLDEETHVIEHREPPTFRISQGRP